MKILTRYLFGEILLPFLFCLIACSTLWIVTDLFGTMEKFLDYKAPFALILKFYLVQLPRMLVTVLPITLLFSNLYTLLRLSRHRELVSIQAGGVHPWRLFSPFFTVAAVCAIAIFVLGAGPAARSESRRQEILNVVRGDPARQVLFQAVIYRDLANRRMWYVQQLDRKSGTATGMEILQQDESGHDQDKYFAQGGNYADGCWHLINVRQASFGPAGNVIHEKKFDELDLTAFTTSPALLTAVKLPPEQMTYSDLVKYLEDSRSADPHETAPFRTQLQYLRAYPSIAFVLLIFSLALGMNPGRRSPTAGVFNSIFILTGFLFVLNFFLAMGAGNRMPAVLAAWAAPVLFGAVGGVMLHRQFGSDGWPTPLRRMLAGLRSL